MKKLTTFSRLLFLFCFSICSLSFSAQNPPKAVIGAFDKMYPSSEVMEWESFQGKYTASFFEGDNYIVSTFDANGNWVQSTRQLTEEQLPKKVNKCWKKKYKEVQFVTAILEVKEKDVKPMYHLSFEADANLVNLVYNRRGRIKSKFSEPIQLD